MEKTVFKISKMDCPSEESLIRMKLDEIGAVKRLEFDIPNRLLTVFHTGGLQKIEQSILALNLDSKRLQTESADPSTVQEQTLQRRLLWSVLGINFSFFVIEMITGLISQSMGLVADSLDMLADSFVYGMSLWAVGGSLVRKKRISRVAGYFQVFLSNDVIINMGVMVAGVLVLWLQSNIPDLIVGAIVFGVVLQGAVRILKLGK
ncbi:MAG: cation transporter [Desulfobacteraceae bacterium]